MSCYTNLFYFELQSESECLNVPLDILIIYCLYPVLFISGPSWTLIWHCNADLRPQVEWSYALISIFYCSIQTSITSKTKHPFKWCDQFH